MRLGPGLLCPPPAVLGFPGLHLGARLPAAQAQAPSPAPRALGLLTLCPQMLPKPAMVFPPPPLPICSPLTCLLSVPPWPHCDQLCSLPRGPHQPIEMSRVALGAQKVQVKGSLRTLIQTTPHSGKLRTEREGSLPRWLLERLATSRPLHLSLSLTLVFLKERQL